MKKVLNGKVIETCKKCEYYYPLSHSCSYNRDKDLKDMKFDGHFNAYWHIHEKCPLPDYIE